MEVLNESCLYGMCISYCGDKWIRTIDKRINSPLLYQLSYIPNV